LIRGHLLWSPTVAEPKVRGGIHLLAWAFPTYTMLLHCRIHAITVIIACRDVVLLTLYVSCSLRYAAKVPDPPKPYGSPTRGITASDVELAANQLLRAGERPTIAKIRASLKGGSPNTINPLLDAWWKKLSARLDSGPAALHRLPESVAHVAEALWMRALDEGRRRALLEQRMTDRALSQDKERLELRSHVLTLREAEMEARVQERDRTAADLGKRVDLLTGMLQKELANRDAISRRLTVVEAELSAARQALARSIPRTSQRRRLEISEAAYGHIENAAVKRRQSRSAKKPRQKIPRH
jgi:hypothetical protein